MGTHPVHVRLFMQTNLHDKPCVHTYLLAAQAAVRLCIRKTALPTWWELVKMKKKCHRPLFFFSVSVGVRARDVMKSFGVRHVRGMRYEERHVNGEWQHATHNMILRNVRTTNCDRTGRNEMKIANDAARCQHFPFFISWKRKNYLVSVCRVASLQQKRRGDQYQNTNLFCLK